MLVVMSNFLMLDIEICDFFILFLNVYVCFPFNYFYLLQITMFTKPIILVLVEGLPYSRKSHFMSELKSVLPQAIQDRRLHFLPLSPEAQMLEGKGDLIKRLFTQQSESLTSLMVLLSDRLDAIKNYVSDHMRPGEYLFVDLSPFYIYHVLFKGDNFIYAILSHE